MCRNFKWTLQLLSFPTAGLFVLVSLAACGGSSGGGGGDNTTNPAISKSVPGNGSVLGSKEDIVIVFNQSMDTSSAVLGGDLASDGADVTWSTSTKSAGGSLSQLSTENDTLTIAPQTMWSTGADRTLTVNANDSSGMAIPTFNLTVNVVQGVVYVSPTGDDNANDGTRDNPKATIKAAISEAVNQGYAPGAVLVSEGNYEVDSGASTYIVLAEGVSLIGGLASDWSERDPATHVTTIKDIATTGGNSSPPNRAIYAPFSAAITDATVVDGFTIRGGGGDSSAAILIDYNQNPHISNNTIHGGSGTSNSFGIFLSFSTSKIVNNSIDGGDAGSFSYGIWNSSASPVIQNNTVHGGRGGFSSTGIGNLNDSSPIIEANLIDGGDGTRISYGIDNSGISNTTAASPTIRNNNILGGSGGNSYGIYSQGNTAPLIEANSIDGGSGATFSVGMSFSDTPVNQIRNNVISGGTGKNAFGLSPDGASPVVENNTIDGGAGLSGSFAISLSTSVTPIPSKPTFKNNIVFTSGNGYRQCFRETDITSDPAVFQNNDLFDCPDGLYLDELSTVLTSIDDVNNLTATTYADNISVDPDFVNRAMGNLHLTIFSPVEVRQGGLDLSSDFTTDRDGATRTDPWSMGAYERD
jgi:hypothetical protein